MKDYFTIKEHYGDKFYYNEYNQRHRLTGPAIEWPEGDKSYWIKVIG